jgi:hypothetical protein
LYEIRLCKVEEIGLLTAFLDNSWSKDHIFTKNKDVLDFQHRASNSYTFVVAYHTETNCFHGVLGIISPEFYVDREIGNEQHLWLAIWKVDKDLAKSNSLGMDMLSFVEAEFSPKSIAAIGINNTVALLYKLIGFKTKTMNQWFLPNRNIVETELLVGDLPEHQNGMLNSSDLIIDCGIEREVEVQQFLSKHCARRSFDYIVKRYLKHPTYKYNVYAFKKNKSDIYAVVVGRKVAGGGANAFRLTEMFFDSDCSSDLGGALCELMERNGFEYIDFLEYGYDPHSLIEIGFMKCSDRLFVPHLFEPFVAERSEVKIAFKSEKPFICTKGDSDLDRPNLG